MRTTIDIDEDVLFAIKDTARRQGISMGRVLSDLVRLTLAGRGGESTRNGVPLFPVEVGAAVVTPELVNRLRDEAP